MQMRFFNGILCSFFFCCLSYLITIFGPIGMAFIRCKIPIFLLFTPVETPVGVVESEAFAVAVRGIGDGGGAAVHANNHFGLTIFFAFVERPYANGHLDIFFLSHFDDD